MIGPNAALVFDVELVSIPSQAEPGAEAAAEAVEEAAAEAVEEAAAEAPAEG